MQIILKYKEIRKIYEDVKFIDNKYKNNNKINVDIDFNPKKL